MGNETSTNRKANAESKLQDTDRQNNSGFQINMINMTSTNPESNYKCMTPREQGARRDENTWRSFQRDGGWTDKYKTRLLEDIDNVKIPQSIGHMNILLVGPIKAGKSSFINTVACIDKDRISQITGAGGDGQSLTKKLKEYVPTNIKGMKIFDTMGVELPDLHGLNIKDFLFLVNGNVKPMYQFNPASPIDVESSDFVKEPSDSNKMHCVVFVMDANVVGQENIPDVQRKKIRALQDELELHDIPRIVLLTKIDVLCEVVDHDITQTYNSAIVRKAVDIAKNLFNAPKQNIFPVQNYESEVDMDFKKDILILLALRQMIYFALDFWDANQIS